MSRLCPTQKGRRNYGVPKNPHGICVGRNVQAEMVRRGITQTTLAPRLAMTQQALSRRISGHTAFKVDELQQIADLLGVPITDLLDDSVTAAS